MPAYFAANGVPQSAAIALSVRPLLTSSGSAGNVIRRNANASSSDGLEGRVRLTATDGIREAVFAGSRFAILVAAAGQPAAVVDIG
jgi:hypothetical protein